MMTAENKRGAIVHKKHVFNWLKLASDKRRKQMKQRSREAADPQTHPGCAP